MSTRLTLGKCVHGFENLNAMRMWRVRLPVCVANQPLRIRMGAGHSIDTGQLEYRYIATN
jgi:hypothetical protein